MTEKIFNTILKYFTATLVLLNVLSLSQLYGGSFTVSPIIITLNPDNNQRQQWITVKATGDQPIAVELSIIKRQINIEGELFHETKETDENFLIYPSQLILFPGDEQIVSIQWLAEFTPNKELVYSFIAEQVKINLNDTINPPLENKLDIGLLLKYQGIVYVRPSGVSSMLTVKSAISKESNNGQTLLVVTLHNQGTARQKINKIKLTVTPVDNEGKQTSKSITYQPEMPAKLIKHSLYAGQLRQCELPWPEGIKHGKVMVSVEP